MTVQRLVVQRRLEGAQALVDRDQLDDRRPGIDQVLERRLDPAEGAQDLLHDAEGDAAGNDGRRERDVGHEDVGLQVAVAGDVEVEVVEIQAEIVAAHVREQLGERRRLGAVGIVLAEHQFLAVGRLDALVAELEPRQPDADDGQQRRCRTPPR